MEYVFVHHFLGTRPSWNSFLFSSGFSTVSNIKDGGRGWSANRRTYKDFSVLLFLGILSGEAIQTDNHFSWLSVEVRCLWSSYPEPWKEWYCLLECKGKWDHCPVKWTHILCNKSMWGSLWCHLLILLCCAMPPRYHCILPALPGPGSYLGRTFWATTANCGIEIFFNDIQN